LPTTTSIDSSWLTDLSSVPVALTVKVRVPSTVGVPVIRPVVAFSDRPLGSVPAVTVHVYGSLPPPASSCPT
jgi:hypothetical protein